MPANFAQLELLFSLGSNLQARTCTETLTGLDISRVTALDMSQGSEAAK